MELAERPPRERAAPAASPRGRRFDYVTVGHVTVDVIVADGSRRAGGGAFYSALQAARLGLRTLIITQGSREEIEALLEPWREELRLHVLPAPATTTLETSWLGERRSQRVLAWAGPIAAAAVAVDTQILHFAPVARETSAGWGGRADFIGLTPQGLARAWRTDREGVGVGKGKAEKGQSGEVVSERLQEDRSSIDALLPKACDAVVISEQERVACAPLLAAATQAGAVLAITAGPGATRVQGPGAKPSWVQTASVGQQRDDLGAGDVFAAAFFVALHEGLSPARAAAFGNVAAAIRIEGSGADAIGDRSAIEARAR